MDGVSNITRDGRVKKILVAFLFLHWFPRHTLTHSLPPHRSPVSAVHCLSLVAATGRPPPLPYARIPGCIFRTTGFQALHSSLSLLLWEAEYATSRTQAI